MEELVPEDDSIFLDVLNEDISIASNVLLEESFSSTCAPVGQSTPLKRRTESAAPSGSGTPSVSAVARLQCSKCSNTYANERTLGVRMKMHAMKSASARIPKEAVMNEFTKEAILTSLKEIQEESPKSELCESLSQYCVFVEECILDGGGQSLILYLSECFLNILSRQNVLLPSALRNTVYRLTNRLLTCRDFREKLKDILSSLKSDSPSVLNFFVGCVCEKVFSWQLTLSLRAIRGHSSNAGETTQRYSCDASHPQEFKQLVYHIGGCVLKGILKKARFYHSNPDWAVYSDVIKTNFLSQPLNSEPSDCISHVKCFTEGKDRGGLTYCNQECFDFFMYLFNLIMSLEGADGSLPIELVESNAFKNDILISMWDDLVGAELTEEQSLSLFADILRCSVRIVAKGILKRRLNEQLLKSYSSVSLRTRVAR